MKFRVLLGYAAPYRISLAVASVLMLSETIAALAVPWLGGQLAAHMLTHAKSESNTLFLGLLSLFAMQAVLSFASAYVLSRTSEHILANLRVSLYDHLQTLPLSFYHAHQKGDLLALVTYEVEQLSSYITGTLLTALPLLASSAGAMLLMFRIDPALACLNAVLIPLFYLALRITGRRIRPLAAQAQEAYATALATAEENFNMLPVLKSFTREAIESGRYRAQIRGLRDITIVQQRINAGLGPVIQFIAAAAVLLLLLLASGRIDRGTMSPAELVTFLLYAAYLTRPVSGLAGIYGQTQRTRGVLARLQRVLSEQPEPLFGSRKALGDVRGSVEFCNVTFHYPGRPALFHDVSLTIRAHEIVAVTGENGAGKSTLMHLLMRLHEPDSGRILIDGHEISAVTLNSLRSKIGWVPQHVLLLNGSVRENIAYGRPDASVQDIENAAIAAQAHPFIVNLPQGYDTIIGEQGLRLSGGQRQRLALARALIKNPPILLLDEATAMFDLKGEEDLVVASRESFAGRTVILIAHRPATLALANRIITLSGGRAIEDGAVCVADRG